MTIDEWGSPTRASEDWHLSDNIFIGRNNLTLKTRIKRPAHRTICFSHSAEVYENNHWRFRKTHVLLTGVPPASLQRAFVLVFHAYSGEDER
ncbi:hypothetical protein RDV39_004786 [Salmonella enterica]|nr:hypothetical protein [Salmonella enterica]